MLSSEERFAAVVVGSGFGGTISALALAKFFASRNQGEKVCILERGQWWISHEITFTPQQAKAPNQQPNMREYLTDTGEPHGFWAHPDNVEGLVKLGAMARQTNMSGVYDYRVLGANIHAITASGVGGGSLVYSNVTLRPHESVYRDWPTEREGKSLGQYFEAAEKFIGVNKITTIAGMGTGEIERSKLFREAALKARQAKGHIINTDQEGFVLNLSISDIPAGTFDNMITEIQNTITPQVAATLTPQIIKQLVPETAKYTTKIQQNVCQRQARCNLGCIPGARHTLNKKLFAALTANPPLPLTIKSLCEAYLIEFEEGQEYPYKIHCKRFNKERDTFERSVVLAKRLIVSAGTLGSNELLLKSAAKGLKLSKILGEKFSPNGDLLGFMKFAEREGIDITRGPINTSHAMFKTDQSEFSFSIEDTSISPMVAGLFATIFELFPGGKRKMSLSKKLSLIWQYPGLASLLLSGLSLSDMQGAFAKLWNDARVRSALVQLAKSGKPQGGQNPTILNVIYSLINSLFTNHESPFASPAERLNGFFVFSCMGVDNADGVLTLKSEWETMEQQDDPGEKLKLEWSPDKNRHTFEEIMQGMQELADGIEPDGGKQVRPIGWDQSTPSKSRLVVLHPLGGCIIGDDSGKGVVNGYGQVYRPDSGTTNQVYPDFYVIDGSIVPGALGVNSSLTIASLTFRCLEKMLGSQFLPN